MTLTSFPNHKWNHPRLILPNQRTTRKMNSQSYWSCSLALTCRSNPQNLDLRIQNWSNASKVEWLLADQANPTLDSNHSPSHSTLKVSLFRLTSHCRLDCLPNKRHQAGKQRRPPKLWQSRNAVGIIWRRLPTSYASHITRWGWLRSCQSLQADQ